MTRRCGLATARGGAGGAAPAEAAVLVDHAPGGTLATRLAAGPAARRSDPGGFLGAAWFVRKKVQREARSMFVKDKQSGFNLWVDRNSGGKRDYTGFTARWGALFEANLKNFAEHSGRLYAVLRGSSSCALCSVILSRTTRTTPRRCFA